jgi:hypothetical protein
VNDLLAHLKGKMTQSFAFEIDAKSSRNGWMDCWLVVDGQRHRLDATSVFPPFGSLLKFAQALAVNSLPHEFHWEEEGHGAKFQALPLAPEAPNFRLAINHDGEIVVDAEFDRMQTALGLLEALRGMALDCPRSESEWEFPYFLIENFEHGLAQGFDPRAEAGLAGDAHFVFNHYGGYGGVETPSFSIWVGNRSALFMAMDDIAHFWRKWFELLEKIRYGNLPAEVIFKREEGDTPGFFSLMLNTDVSSHFQISEAMEPRLFRLQIAFLSSAPERETYQPYLDAVLDRNQFVNEFVRAFQGFLKTNYIAFLEGGETTFDLRVLPLHRLTS